MSKKELSVILPVYNASAYVGAAIESILHQRFRDFELLIADDGSTDNSLEVIRSFNDPRIRILVNETNLGLIGTLNRLMNESSCGFVARMDADDIAPPDRFTIQMDLMKNNPALGVVSSYMSILGVKASTVKHRFLSDAYVKAALPFTNPIVHPAVLFRKSCLPKGELYSRNYLHAEDYGLWIDLIAKTKFEVVPLPLIDHRQHEGQVSVSYYEQQKRSVKKAHNSLCNQLGISPTEAELELQLSLFLEKFEATPDYIERTDAWLNKLVCANEERKLLPATEFGEVAGEWWFRVCQSLNAGVKRYRRSPLSRLYSPALKSKVKLIAKSIVSTPKNNKRSAP